MVLILKAFKPFLILKNRASSPAQIVPLFIVDNSDICKAIYVNFK